MHGRVGGLLCLLLSALLPATATARALQQATGSTCSALRTGSLQLEGGKISAVDATTSDGCCEACAKTAGCQLFQYKGNNKCEMFGLGKGPVTATIMYSPTNTVGLITKSPSALVEHSTECDGNTWLFKNVAFDGVVKATSADPYILEAGRFNNGFPAKTWQECCKGAMNAPGTTVMEPSYQYRARQYWTWNEAEGKCYVKVRPFQVGATVLTMRKAAGVISGMFGNEP